LPGATFLDGAPTNEQMRVALISLVLVGLVGCAHDVHVRFPAPPDVPTGTLVLLLSQSASDVNVAINGVLVVQSQHTSLVEVTNVPTGHDDVVMTANGVDKAFRVWVESDHPTTVPLGVPGESLGFFKSILGTLISLVAWSLLK
jgi:hypothetical protein